MEKYSRIALINMSLSAGVILLAFFFGAISGHYHGVAQAMTDNLMDHEKVYCVRPTGDITTKN